MSTRADCLAIFDWAPIIRSADFVRLMLGFIEGFGNIVVTTQLKTSATKKTRTLTRKKLDDYLKNSEPFQYIEIECYRQTAPSKATDLIGMITVSEIEKYNKTAFIGISEGILSESNNLSLAGLAGDLAALGSLGYGIGFSWPTASTAYYHAVGIGTEPAESDEERHLARMNSLWFQERLSMKGAPPKMRHLRGMFRDIYELNILNRNHLANMIGGRELAVFIKEKCWGALEQLNSENWLWTVESRCFEEIRRVFSNQGLLLD